MISADASVLQSGFFKQAGFSHGSRDERDLSTSPDVELDGFPFLFSVARGRLDSASVAIEDYTVEGLVVREATLDLDGVDFALRSIINAAWTSPPKPSSSNRPETCTTPPAKAISAIATAKPPSLRSWHERTRPDRIARCSRR